jgi:LPS export ABC transporter protein LptC
MKGYFRYVVAAMVLAGFFQISCGSKPEKLVTDNGGEGARPEPASALIEITQQLEDVRFSQSKGDRLLWKLEAKAVEQTADGPISLERVEITYYADDGRVTVLKADTGVYDGAGRNATLSGNVTVNTSDGGRVETSEIEWDQERELLTGEGEVTISRGASSITGTGFELHPTEETFKIHQVDGVIYKGDMDS